jgi:hypothetical protein
MDFSQSALSFDFSFQFGILNLLIHICTQFHHLFFGHPLSQLPWGLLVNTWLLFFYFTLLYFTSLLLSILLTWPIQFNWLILTNESVSKSPNTYINFLLCHFLQFLCTSIPQSIHNTFLSKGATHLAISFFKNTRHTSVWYMSIPKTIQAKQFKSRLTSENFPTQ